MGSPGPGQSRRAVPQRGRNGHALRQSVESRPLRAGRGRRGEDPGAWRDADGAGRGAGAEERGGSGDGGIEAPVIVMHGWVVENGKKPARVVGSGGSRGFIARLSAARNG